MCRSLTDALAVLGGNARVGQAVDQQEREVQTLGCSGRRQGPDATQRLLELLEGAEVGAYHQASALALLGRQERNAAAVPVLTGLAEHPDPRLRARALQALLVHDEARRAHWLSRGSEDPHAFVRLAVFDATKEEELLDAARIRSSLEDRLRTAIRPAILSPFLLRAAKIHLRRGDRTRARPYLDLALRWTTPHHARDLELDQLDWLVGPARSEPLGPPVR